MSALNTKEDMSKSVENKIRGSPPITLFFAINLAISLLGSDIQEKRE